MASWKATKPLSLLSEEAAEEGQHTLRRSSGPMNLITLGIGAIVGAGIFVLTGQAAALHAGPAIALSFVFAGLTCAFADFAMPSSRPSFPLPAPHIPTATPRWGSSSPGSSAGPWFLSMPLGRRLWPPAGRDIW